MHNYNNILVTDGVYHIYSRSIANFKIFNNDTECSRMQKIIKYYQTEDFGVSFSRGVPNNSLERSLPNQERLVNIIAYCIMGTHIHLILKQLEEKGISIFISRILNSYTRYFNTRHKRKGPLWESRFKRVLVTTDEQLLHLTRYVHLNPVTAYFVDRPQEWKFSSYNEYLSGATDKETICNYEDILNITPEVYRKFVEDYIDYQRKLAHIKDLILDQDTTS